ncbi:hypothetical protein [Marinobacter sp. EVN1]|uniref:hypothetical protein n=1 Tax=Marinobacter sp. EVN1 TaxID=1397532 RepID=UPI001377FC4B|nr:hypothetical protein [Marinobacter sp. EVN1]
MPRADRPTFRQWHRRLNGLGVLLMALESLVQLMSPPEPQGESSSESGGSI